MTCEPATSIAGIECACGLKQQHTHFVCSNGAMLYPSGYDQHFAGSEGYRTIAEFHIECTLEHIKQLVFMLMAVPNESALKLDELDMLTVEGCNNSRVPVI